MDAVKAESMPLASWDMVLVTIAGTPITLSALLSLLLALIALPIVAKLLQHWISDRLLARTHLDLGARQAIGTLIRYAVLITGFVLVMQNAGVNLAAFSVLAGAVGVGIGFGLQNIFSNFISGLIIMIERPVKVGDRIDVVGFEGDVVAVGARSTTITTARKARVIVPNQKIITEVVRNWEAEGHRSSLILTLKVAAAHAPADVRSLLLETAKSTPQIEASPEPSVELLAVEAVGNTFQLQVWTEGDSQQRAAVQSTLYFALATRFASQGIQLA